MGSCEDIQKNIELIKHIIHMFKEDRENYNLAMFTHAIDFFKKCVSLKKPIPEHLFYKLLEQFVDRGFGNACTRRKTCIFDCSLRLNFNRKRHFATKILLVA